MAVLIVDEILFSGVIVDIVVGSLDIDDTYYLDFDYYYGIPLGNLIL